MNVPTVYLKVRNVRKKISYRIQWYRCFTLSWITLDKGPYEAANILAKILTRLTKYSK
jgi:hypothetical protein